MPSLRAFRALRYSMAAVPDLATVLCPPYDIIAPDEQEACLRRDPRNAVRLELPPSPAGAEPEARYRAAARTMAEWRSDGVLLKDRRPTLTVHQMRWRSGDGATGSATGVFARIGLEPFGPSAGVRPHERTMSGPREDRYLLLRATGANISPIVLLAPDAGGGAAGMLARLADRPADIEATTGDGVSHRLWTCPAGDAAEPADEGAAEADAGRLLGLLAGAPLTIADGHHRYETALRYRDERGRNRACESDPAWDYVMALVYPADLAPPVLPTHRVVIGGPAGEDLLAAAGRFFVVERLAGGAELLARMASPVPMHGSGTGRFGLLSGPVAAILTVREAEVGPLLDASLSEASRGLDVNRLAAVLERLMGVDAATLAAGGRLAYVKDAAEAVAVVERGEGASCFLLDPLPVMAVTAVAAAGEVMPPKSTYFHPKAPTGLLFGPLEW